MYMYCNRICIALQYCLFDYLFITKNVRDFCSNNYIVNVVTIVGDYLMLCVWYCMYCIDVS